MKTYPTIQREYMKGTHIYAFDKYDGSNIRVEWSAKRGFYKFGTKTQLIDKDSPIFGEAVGLFNNKYSESLTEVFKKQRWQSVVCFAELYGKNSFAGNHLDEEHDVVLFDVSVNDTILDPRDFIDCFEHLHIPALVHRGTVGEELIKQIHNSQIEGITFEGVVCKCTSKNKESPRMFKIKTNAWIDKLKTYCNGNANLFARLL